MLTAGGWLALLAGSVTGRGGVGASTGWRLAVHARPFQYRLNAGSLWSGYQPGSRDSPAMPVLSADAYRTPRSGGGTAGSGQCGEGFDGLAQASPVAEGHVAGHQGEDPMPKLLVPRSEPEVACGVE